MKNATFWSLTVHQPVKMHMHCAFHVHQQLVFISNESNEAEPQVSASLKLKHQDPFSLSSSRVKDEENRGWSRHKASLKHAWTYVTTVQTVPVLEDSSQSKNHYRNPEQLRRKYQDESLKDDDMTVSVTYFYDWNKISAKINKNHISQRVKGKSPLLSSFNPFLWQREDSTNLGWNQMKQHISFQDRCQSELMYMFDACSCVSTCLMITYWLHVCRRVRGHSLHPDRGESKGGHTQLLPP